MPPKANRKADNFYTPDLAIEPLVPFLNNDWIIWECAFGEGDLSNSLNKRGFNVVGTPDYDFLKENSDNIFEFDCIITNPPFSLKDKFLERCFEIGKPFALLLPITALEGKFRQKLYRENGIQLILFDKRVSYLNHKGDGSCWFPSCWFVGNMGLSKDLNFVELKC